MVFDAIRQLMALSEARRKPIGFVVTISSHLAKLRAGDIVRYDSTGREVRYWLKHKRETRELLKALERIAHTPPGSGSLIVRHFDISGIPETSKGC